MIGKEKVRFLAYADDICIDGRRRRRDGRDDEKTGGISRRKKASTKRGKDKEEWTARGAGKGERTKGNDGARTNMGDWKEKIQKGHEKKSMAIRQADMDCGELRGGDMGMGGERSSGKSTDEVHEVGAGSGFKNTRIYSERRIEEGKVGDESGQESLEFRSEIGEGKREQMGEELLLRGIASVGAQGRGGKTSQSGQIALRLFRGCGEDSVDVSIRADCAPSTPGCTGRQVVLLAVSCTG
ncbi:hypothetical protein PV328_011908, partial [Microctonus aethiopoides]